jgi:hypothetical protein
MEALNRNPEAQASGEHRCMALFGVQVRDVFRYGEGEQAEHPR